MSHNRLSIFIFIWMLISNATKAQTLDIASDSVAFAVRQLFEDELKTQKSFEILSDLCTQIGPRISGSDAASQAVQWGVDQFESSGVSATKIPCEVPVWTRGEEVYEVWADAWRSLSAVSLGNAPGTDDQWFEGALLEVLSLEALKQLPDAAVAGKIVFFNRPMDPAKLNTFHAYGGAVDQRVFGPALAAKKGAIATMVRSMASGVNKHPHTGVTIFAPDEPAIPAFAISTYDAELLSARIKREKTVRCRLKSTCMMHEPKLSYSVVGEWRGSVYPDSIILVGGHLDSWDVGQGAHDDGAGIAHTIGVLELLKRIGYVPKHTLRFVLFMNEENGLAGGKSYADSVLTSPRRHIAAIESDRGGFAPRGFSFDCVDSMNVQYSNYLSAFQRVLGPYELTIKVGGSGADIGPLKPSGALLMGLRVDSQRYFDYHHSDTDRIEAVNPRELALGTAAIATMVYLLDQFPFH